MTKQNRALKGCIEYVDDETTKYSCPYLSLCVWLLLGPKMNSSNITYSITNPPGITSEKENIET